jgi:hypothetical protein
MIFLIPAREEDYQSPTVRFGIALVGVLLIVSTPFAAHSSYRVYQEARQSERWPTSDGEITRSEVEERKEDLTKTVYWPKVQYRYTVAERVYEGTRVNFDESGSQYSGRIESLVKRFPLGAKVPVYYDRPTPRRPCSIRACRSGSGSASEFPCCSCFLASHSSALRKACAPKKPSQLPPTRQRPTRRDSAADLTVAAIAQRSGTGARTVHRPDSRPHDRGPSATGPETGSGTTPIRPMRSIPATALQAMAQSRPAE